MYFDVLLTNKQDAYGREWVFRPETFFPPIKSRFILTIYIVVNEPLTCFIRVQSLCIICKTFGYRDIILCGNSRFLYIARLTSFFFLFKTDKRKAWNIKRKVHKRPNHNVGNPDEINISWETGSLRTNYLLCINLQSPKRYYHRRSEFYRIVIYYYPDVRRMPIYAYDYINIAIHLLQPTCNAKKSYEVICRYSCSLAWRNVYSEQIATI